jgi:hypothetical protein
MRRDGLRTRLAHGLRNETADNQSLKLRRRFPEAFRRPTLLLILFDRFSLMTVLHHEGIVR